MTPEEREQQRKLLLERHARRLARAIALKRSAIYREKPRMPSLMTRAMRRKTRNLATSQRRQRSTGSIRCGVGRNYRYGGLTLSLGLKEC